MSGVCGLLSLDGSPAPPDPVRAMLEAMAYRGADGLQHVCAGPAVLGQARCHVTREASRSPLPYSVPGHGLHLVFDGQLDNAPELATTLQLASAASDVELLAAAYLRWGEDCVRRLDGDFAFAIWHAARERLLCARDPTGTRPFYYYRGKALFAFATELPPLLALAEAPLAPNQDMLTQFLTQCWVSNEDTFWQSFRRLPPAHALLVDPGTVSLRRYWQPDFQQTPHYPDLQDYRNHYRELLAGVVRRQTRSRYPVAFEVSGGLDSSALFASACALQRRGELNTPAVAGLTLDFRGVDDADEVAHAQAVGRHCGQAIEVVPPVSQPLEWYRSRGRSRGEFCGAPNGVMSQGLFARAAARGCRVLVNGTGGDEWLDAGDAAYAEAFAGKQVGEVLAMLRQHAAVDGWLQASGSAMRASLAGKLPRALLDRVRSRYRQKDPEQAHVSLLRRRQLQSLRAQELRVPPELTFTASWQRPLWHRLNDPYSLLAHETMEVLAAEAGLVLRRPYWSRSMVEFSLGLPRRVLSVPGENRSLHRQAMGQLLPAAVLERADKADFDCSFGRLTAQLASALVNEDDIHVDPAWVDDGALRRRLRAACAADPGSADWALWFLFSCAAVMNRCE